MVDPRTPVLVGVGQFTERIDDADYRGMATEQIFDALGAQADIPPETRTELLSRLKVQSWDELLELVSGVMPGMGGIFWQIWIVANGIGAYSLLAATGRCPRPDC